MGQTHSGVAAVLHDLVAQAKDSIEPPVHLLDTISFLAQPTELPDLLLSLAKDDQAISACAARSFHHPLGFTKLTLIDALPAYMLRVHVWWPDRKAGVDHIHNHRFNFVSSIVCGGYDMPIYEQARRGLPMIEYQEEVSIDLGWRLRCRGRARLKELTTLRLRAGCAYAFSREALHRTTVLPSSPCVSLFLQTAMSKSTTKVFVDQADPTPIMVRKEPLTSEYYRSQLEAVLVLLSTGQSDMALRP